MGNERGKWQPLDYSGFKVLKGEGRRNKNTIEATIVEGFAKAIAKLGLTPQYFLLHFLGSSAANLFPRAAHTTSALQNAS